MTRQALIAQLLTGAAVYDGADVKQLVDKAEEIADEVLRRFVDEPASETAPYIPYDADCFIDHNGADVPLGMFGHASADVLLRDGSTETLLRSTARWIWTRRDPHPMDVVGYRPL